MHSTILSPLLLDSDGQPYRRRDGRLVYLIQGGADDDNGGDGDSGGAGDGTTGASDDRGFPANTPLTDMKPEEQAAYWRFQARKHENAYKGLDLDALKAKAAAHDAAEAAKLTPSEQAIREAKEAGKAEAAVEANRKTATAILRVSLQTRGKTAEAVEAIIAATNPDSFIANGDVDTDKVAAYADQFSTGTTGVTAAGMGQGNQSNRTKSTGVAAGRDMFASKRPK